VAILYLSAGIVTEAGVYGGWAGVVI
jgi:hypothetical protein